MPQQQQSNVIELPSKQHLHNATQYYIIFDPSDDMPPQITDSWDCAQRWKNKGCIIEPYSRPGFASRH